MLEGGSRARKFCLVEHDDQEHTIFEYKMADQKSRDWMVFQTIITLDLGTRVISNLINENKVLCHDYMNKDLYTIFNLDMKVYWQVDKDLLREIHEGDDAEVNFVPESHKDGLIIRQSSKLVLSHGFQTQRMKLGDKVQSYKTQINPYKRNEVVIVSAEQTKPTSFKLKVQKLIISK